MYYFKQLVIVGARPSRVDRIISMIAAHRILCPASTAGGSRLRSHTESGGGS